MAATAIGNWTDEQCFYVSIVDGQKFGLLLGPFRTEKECREWAYIDESDGGDKAKHLKMINLAHDLDAKSVFYGFGMTKMANGHRSGVLNSRLGL